MHLVTIPSRSQLLEPLLVPDLGDPGHHRFRPIHYLGSKLRIIESISSALDRLDPERKPVCDLFAGSGTVSLHLAQTRRVISVDIQEYSRVICSALLKSPPLYTNDLANWFHAAESARPTKVLQLAAEPLIEYENMALEQAARGITEPLCDIIEHGCIVSFQQGWCETKNRKFRLALKRSCDLLEREAISKAGSSLAFRYFGGLYFSYAQSIALDSLLEAAASVVPGKRETLVAVVLSTASDIVNTVGRQFAQPLKPRDSDGSPKRNLIAKALADRKVSVERVAQKWFERYSQLKRSKDDHLVIRSDYAEALVGHKGKIGVVYADPPYTRDHYSRFYHVLETLCLRDNPEVSTISINGRKVLSRGIYRTERHQSPFCIKSQAAGAFERLFQAVSVLGVPLLLSYSPFESESDARPRLLTIESLKMLARKYFSSVQIESPGPLAHSKLNVTRLNTSVKGDAEVFVLCR